MYNLHLYILKECEIKPPTVLYLFCVPVDVSGPNHANSALPLITSQLPGTRDGQ